MHWLQKPSKEELIFLKKTYTQKKSIRQRLAWYFIWRKWTRSPGADVLKLIENRLQLLKKTEKRDWILKKFYDLGISDANSELEVVTNLIEKTDIKHWEQYQNEKNDFKDIISHKDLYKSIDILKHQFDFKEKDQPLEILNQISSKKELLLDYWTKISEIPANIHPFLDQKIAIIESNVHKSIVGNIVARYPELRQFSIANFINECIDVNETFNEESNIFVSQLLQGQYDQFQNFEKLTTTPPKKLNETDKILRKRLKKGKSILIKEFGKKKAHQSIRKLFNSDAYLWIQILKPLWMSNPNNLSESLPLKKELFDFLIADESSQLLLSHSIGGLQRGKKSIICGDPKQMSPSGYFKKKQQLEIDLLHHANYYLKHVFLSNHYRSLHPNLIAFSNLFFYQNKLKAFEHISAPKHPVQHHFIKDGCYSERININEAMGICTFISKHINSKEKIGIVAFSEAQLSCIYEHLNPETRIILNQRIEEDSLFFQSLEKVQGDECDRLIISFGYAANPDGKFELRFGPLNMQGGHKRLNVLFSRAKKRIDFFSSVKLKDFPSSQNEGVIYLKKWFELCEKKIVSKPPKSIISIDDLLKDCSGFNDLISYLNVYQVRGYELFR